MKLRMLPIAAAVLLAGAAVAVAQEATKIKWTPKAGSSQNYRLVVNGNMQGMDFEFSTKIAHKVVEVRPDGNIVVEERQHGGEVKLNGTAMDVPGGMPEITVRMVSKPNGEIVERKSNGPEGMENPRLENSFAFIFPDKDLKPGDTWKRETKADKAKETYSTETVYTYAGTETLNGKKTHKITFKFREIDAPSNMTGEGTVWLRVEDGELVKGTYNLKNAEFAAGMGATDATATMTMVD
jgi:hypothetical protein